MLDILIAYLLPLSEVVINAKVEKDRNNAVIRKQNFLLRDPYRLMLKQLIFSKWTKPINISCSIFGNLPKQRFLSRTLKADDVTERRRYFRKLDFFVVFHRFLSLNGKSFLLHSLPTNRSFLCQSQNVLNEKHLVKIFGRCCNNFFPLQRIRCLSSLVPSANLGCCCLRGRCC